MYAALIDAITHIKPYYLLLLQAFLVLLIPYLLWRPLQLGRFFPLSVIQIFTGVLLGPSIFGALLPDLQKALFGPIANIGAVANVAICIFGFLAGTEADKETIRNSGRSIIAIGAFGMLASWLLASLVGVGIYYGLPVTHPPEANPAAFAAAFGLAIAVSALPVLMLIMREVDVMNKRLGAVTLAAAGLADMIMWLGLALTIAFSGIGKQSPLASATIAFTSGGSVVVLILFLFNPLLNRLIAQDAQERVIISVTAIAIFLSATITGIGELHPVFGAFMAGVLLPDKVRHMAANRFDMMTVMVLMPFFFLFTGLRTVFPYNDPNIWILFVVSTVLCVAAKVVASAVPARMMGEPWPFSVATGLLLQTKGLMGLLVITAFYDKGIVTLPLFSAIVVMCMVSTGIPALVVRWMKAKYGPDLYEGKTALPRPAVPAAAPVAAE